MPATLYSSSLSQSQRAAAAEGGDLCRDTIYPCLRSKHTQSSANTASECARVCTFVGMPHLCSPELRRNALLRVHDVPNALLAQTQQLLRESEDNGIQHAPLEYTNNLVAFWNESKEMKSVFDVAEPCVHYLSSVALLTHALSFDSMDAVDLVICNAVVVDSRDEVRVLVLLCRYDLRIWSEPGSTAQTKCMGSVRRIRKDARHRGGASRFTCADR
jgi:hypothetical protein